MKRWKSLTAALCAAVLLCGFSTTAYAGGGEYEDYGDPTMETPAPEPTKKPWPGSMVGSGPGAGAYHRARPGLFGGGWF